MLLYQESSRCDTTGLITLTKSSNLTVSSIDNLYQDATTASKASPAKEEHNGPSGSVESDMEKEAIELLSPSSASGSDELNRSKRDRKHDRGSGWYNPLYALCFSRKVPPAPVVTNEEYYNVSVLFACSWTCATSLIAPSKKFLHIISSIYSVVHHRCSLVQHFLPTSCLFV